MSRKGRYADFKLASECWGPGSAPHCLFCGDWFDPFDAEYDGAVDVRTVEDVLRPGGIPAGNVAILLRRIEGDPHVLGELVGHICPACLGGPDGFEGRLRDGLRGAARRLREEADEFERVANLAI